MVRWSQSHVTIVRKIIVRQIPHDRQDDRTSEGGAWPSASCEQDGSRRANSGGGPEFALREPSCSQDAGGHAPPSEVLSLTVVRNLPDGVGRLQLAFSDDRP